MSRLYMALVHHPVYNRRGETISAALTNLDLHDLSRAGRTYGVSGFFVVTPLDDQRRLARELVGHWTDGFGATYNTDRKEAMSLVSVVATLDDAIAAVQAESGSRPRLVATAAREGLRPQVAYAELAASLKEAGPACLLLFGTASGMAEEVIERVDAVLPPIRGAGDYNHLSVRSAAAIVLDRLVGRNGA